MISFEQFQVLVESQLVWTFLIFMFVVVVILGIHSWFKARFIDKSNNSKIYNMLIKSTTKYQEDSERRITKLEVENEEIKNEVDKYKNEYFVLLTKMTVLEAKIYNLEEENTELKARQTELLIENKSLRQSMEVMQHELKQKDDAIKELTRRQDGTEHRTT